MVMPAAPVVRVLPDMLTVRVGFLGRVPSLLMLNDLHTAEVSLWREDQVGILGAIDAHPDLEGRVHLPLWVLAAVSTWGVFVHSVSLVAQLD